MKSKELNMERRISNDFDKAIDSLTSIEKANRPRIPEELFKTVFLGLFANLNNQHPDATIQNWVAIAGNPFTEVDVCGEGKVLFTVPALFNKDAIKPQIMGQSEPLSHIVATAQQLSARSPIEGQNYIDNKYASTSRKIQNQVDRLAYVQEWNMIFKRYGLPEIIELKNTETSKSVISKDIKDELRRDDLDFTIF